MIGKDGIDRKGWETALLFAIRDGLRSGDLWIAERKIALDQAFKTVGELARRGALPNAAIENAPGPPGPATPHRAMKRSGG